MLIIRFAYKNTQEFNLQRSSEAIRSTLKLFYETFSDSDGLFEFSICGKKIESHKTQHSFETEIALISKCRIRTSLIIIEKKCKSCRYFVVPVCTSSGRTFITLLFLNEGVPLRRLNYSILKVLYCRSI